MIKMTNESKTRSIRIEDVTPDYLVNYDRTEDGHYVLDDEELDWWEDFDNRCIALGDKTVWRDEYDKVGIRTDDLSAWLDGIEQYWMGRED